MKTDVPILTPSLFPSPSLHLPPPPSFSLHLPFCPSPLPSSLSLSPPFPPHLSLILLPVPPLPPSILPSVPLSLPPSFLIQQWSILFRFHCQKNHIIVLHPWQVNYKLHLILAFCLSCSFPLLMFIVLLFSLFLHYSILLFFYPPSLLFILSFFPSHCSSCKLSYFLYLFTPIAQSLKCMSQTKVTPKVLISPGQIKDT